MSARSYPTTLVECPTCHGEGEVEWEDPLLYGAGEAGVIRCPECFGALEVEVCENCLGAGCAVCGGER